MSVILGYLLLVRAWWGEEGGSGGAQCAHFLVSPSDTDLSNDPNQSQYVVNCSLPCNKFHRNSTKLSTHTVRVYNGSNTRGLETSVDASNNGVQRPHQRNVCMEWMTHVVDISRRLQNEQPTVR